MNARQKCKQLKQENERLWREVRAERFRRAFTGSRIEIETLKVQCLLPISAPDELIKHEYGKMANQLAEAVMKRVDVETRDYGDGYFETTMRMFVGKKVDQ